MRLGWKFLSRSFVAPEQGAQTLVYLASAPEAGEVSGDYFADCRPRRISPQANDAALGAQLWEQSEQMVGLG